MAKNIFRPFAVALSGLAYAFKTQRHMRFHLYTVILVILIGLFMNLRLREMIVLLFMVSFVVVAEMFNSAIESVVDLVEPKYSPQAKLAKDMAAGGVLITTVTAVVVALLLFLGDGRWEEIVLQLASPNQQTSSAAKIVLGFFVLFILIVIFKGLGKRGEVLKGGLVSGHSAYAFFLAVAVIFMSNNLAASAIAILLAVMVAQSRWESKIHSLAELGLGATLGTLLAVILFGFGGR